MADDLNRQRRRRRTPEEAREEILAAAESILLDIGPQGLKLADVAAAAGEPHSTLLHHFGSVAKLRCALVRRMTERLLNEITALALKADGTGDVAIAIVRRVFDIYARPENAKLIAWLATANSGEIHKSLDEQTIRLRDIIQQHLMDVGRPDRATPANVAGLLTTAMMAAIGQEIGRSVIAKPLLDDLHEGQTRDWIAELIVAKLGVRPAR